MHRPVTTHERDLRNCRKACKKVVDLCEAALAAYTVHTPGTEPYGPIKVALINCLSACELTLRALAAREDLTYMAAWCGSTCRETMACLNCHEFAPDLSAACRVCAEACSALTVVTLPESPSELPLFLASV
jgi:hypothetical protein